MGQKKGRGSYSREFKEDAVRLATGKGVPVGTRRCGGFRGRMGY